MKGITQTGMDETRYDGIKISTLSNSMSFFIDAAYIVAKDENFRLVVIHNKRLLADENYKSAKGARIAFLKLFWYKAWKEDVKPEWTHFYKPDRHWLRKLIIFKESA